MIPKNELRFLPREWKLPRLDCCYTNRLSALISRRMLVRANQALQLTWMHACIPSDGIPHPTAGYPTSNCQPSHCQA